MNQDFDQRLLQTGKDILDDAQKRTKQMVASTGRSTGRSTGLSTGQPTLPKIGKAALFPEFSQSSLRLARPSSAANRAVRSILTGFLKSSKRSKSSKSSR